MRSNNAVEKVDRPIKSLVYYQNTEEGLRFRVEPDTWRSAGWYKLFEADEDMFNDYAEFINTPKSIVKEHGYGWTSETPVKVDCIRKIRAAYKVFYRDVIGAVIDSSRMFEVPSDDIIDIIYVEDRAGDIVMQNVVVTYLWGGVKEIPLLDVIEEQAMETKDDDELY